MNRRAALKTMFASAVGAVIPAVGWSQMDDFNLPGFGKTVERYKGHWSTYNVRRFGTGEYSEQIMLCSWPLGLSMPKMPELCWPAGYICPTVRVEFLTEPGAEMQMRRFVYELKKIF